MAFDILVKHGGTSVKDFLSSLLEPLQTQTDDMKSFETEYRKRARFNGQKIVLQAALNDIFNVTSPPYIIIDTYQGIGNNLYFFEVSETSPTHFFEASELDPVYFFESSELSPLDYDFKVRIPSGIYTTEIDRRIKAEVTIYKLAGKRFLTETY
jgi:hypothetical protein